MSVSSQVSSTRKERIARGLTYLLGGAGVLHFLHPRPFDTIVPARLPGKSRIYTYVSGAIELLLARGFSQEKTRKIAGIVAAIFFAAVFPANVTMFVQAKNNPRSSLWYKLITLGRLPLQLPLIGGALAVAGKNLCCCHKRCD